MADILSTIAEATKFRVKASKEVISDTAVRDMAYASGKGDFAFEKALGEEGMSYILECKKASPSKGIIAEFFPFIDIAKSYEEAGASAISVLTEPEWFKGDIGYLRQISREVKIPCLRKDFVVDEYMIYEAKANGASAVLLICSILTAKQLGEYIRIADELGLSALVEAHDQHEAQIAVGEGARIVGVNNRDLKDFTVDPLNCLRLREYVPDDVLFVAESGIKTHDDITRLLINKVDAVLIGESVMRAPDKKAFMDELRYGA
ncbi:indole-3-glycerol phosphate synthase [Ruminococcaceae bacterium YRB3002]|nr:indole-3-glycerol phosphate synthase [Ruminococcaceae bacterium YRB3002]